MLGNFDGPVAAVDLSRRSDQFSLERRTVGDQLESRTRRIDQLHGRVRQMVVFYLVELVRIECGVICQGKYLTRLVVYNDGSSRPCLRRFDGLLQRLFDHELDRRADSKNNVLRWFLFRYTFVIDPPEPVAFLDLLNNSSVKNVVLRLFYTGLADAVRIAETDDVRRHCSVWIRTPLLFTIMQPGKIRSVRFSDLRIVQRLVYPFHSLVIEALRQHYEFSFVGFRRGELRCKFLFFNAGHLCERFCRSGHVLDFGRVGVKRFYTNAHREPSSVSVKDCTTRQLAAA